MAALSALAAAKVHQTRLQGLEAARHGLIVLWNLLLLVKFPRMQLLVNYIVRVG